MTIKHKDLEEPTYASRFSNPEIEHPPVLAFVTDCKDDLAKTKVEIAKVSAFGKNWHILDTVGNPSFSTHVLGEQAAVFAGLLGDYSKKNQQPVFLIANSAPRINGEGLIGGEILVIVLDNDVPVLITNGPGALDPFKGHVKQAWKLETDAMDWLPSTQFRSFAWFSELAKQFQYNDPLLVKTHIDDISTYIIPHVGDFCWADDSFGNIKLTFTQAKLNALGIEDGDIVTFRIGDREVTAAKRDKLFPVPEGVGPDHIGLYKGSDKDLNGNHYYELAIAHGDVRAWIADRAPLLDADGNVITDKDAPRRSIIGGENIEVIGIVKAIDRDRDTDDAIRPSNANGATTASLSAAPVAIFPNEATIVPQVNDFEGR